MAYAHTYDALVLRTYDVGEADRFCVLLTRERGKIAARARGVRRLQSSMGGCLLPLQRITASVHEGKTGLLITAAQHKERFASTDHFELFIRTQQVTDMVLLALHDEEPAEDIFDTTVDFLRTAAMDATVPSSAFGLRLLSLLGLLPISDHVLFARWSDTQRTYVRTATLALWNALPSLSLQEERQISALCAETLAEQAGRTSKVIGISQK